MNCDKCLFSHRLVSENGSHLICCLPHKSVVECLISGKHYVEHPMYKEKKDG